MEMEYLNCRCCGGVLDTFSNLTVCEHCGATNFISDVANKKIFQLNRANKLRQESEFDNAARIYDNILEEYGPTADILWYRALCEYGIEYVPDPLSDRYYPTLHRINDESILDCDFFKQSIELCEGEQKDTLLEEAKYIDEVQTKYLNIAADEAPYDVFICYKETDLDTGEETEDVKLAEELYKELTNRGYKVFFARKTLEEKLSIEYEPYIFAALKSAKAMAVIGTKAEYFSSVWVKNEWGRFLKFMEKNREKQIFFACDDPEELPRAFAYKQAQILGEKGAIKNLANNIDNFLNGKNTAKKNLSKSDIEKLYNEALSKLESDKQNGAKLSINRFISQNPADARGYWLSMLFNNNAKPSNIRQLPRYLYADPDYAKAISLAQGDLKEEYTEIGAICNKNLKYQDEFSKIVREKLDDYSENFDGTESGQKKEKILEKLIRYSSQADTYNDKLRFSFAIGYGFFYMGTLILFFISFICDYFGLYYTEGIKYSLMCRNLFSATLILAGMAIALSYNMVLDIITTAVCAILLSVSIFIPFHGFLWIFLAVLIPMIVYIVTRNSYLNEHKNLIKDASSKINRELENLDKIINTDAYEEMHKRAEELSIQFKEDKNIESIIEIREEDYIKEYEDINKIYEYAKEEYSKYIELSFPKKVEMDSYFTKESDVKKESALSAASGAFLIIPFLISPIMAIIDVTSDKYKKYKHTVAYGAMIVSVVASIFFYWIAEF